MSSDRTEKNIEELAKKVKSNDIIQKRIEGDYDYLGEGRNSSALSLTSEDSRHNMLLKSNVTTRKTTLTRMKSVDRMKTRVRGHRTVEKTQPMSEDSAKAVRKPVSVKRKPTKRARTPTVTRSAETPTTTPIKSPAKSPMNQPSEPITSQPAVSPSPSVITFQASNIQTSDVKTKQPKSVISSPGRDKPELKKSVACCVCCLCLCWLCCSCMCCKKKNEDL